MRLGILLASKFLDLCNPIKFRERQAATWAIDISASKTKYLSPNTCLRIGFLLWLYILTNVMYDTINTVGLALISRLYDSAARGLLEASYYYSRSSKDEMIDSHFNVVRNSIGASSIECSLIGRFLYLT
jgi:hypothetical protein